MAYLEFYGYRDIKVCCTIMELCLFVKLKCVNSDFIKYNTEINISIQLSHGNFCIQLKLVFTYFRITNGPSLVYNINRVVMYYFFPIFKHF